MGEEELQATKVDRQHGAENKGMLTLRELGDMAASVGMLLSEVIPML